MKHTQYLNTKIILLVIGIIFFNFVRSYSQPQGWQWAKSAGSLNGSDGGNIAIDASGNVFMAGTFGSPSITFGFTTLLNKGNDDVFIAKYHSSGNVFWAQGFGRSDIESARGIKIDASGNIFVTGTFKGPTIVFDTDTLTNHSVNNYDFFLVKLNTNGNVLWAKSFGGSSSDYASDINLGSDGSIVVSGSFSSPTITFGDTTLTISDSSSYFYDAFVVKFDADGNTIWAKKGDGSQVDYGYGNCIDASSNIYVTGSFRSPTISFGDITLTNNGNWDMFVVKYDADGNVLWAKSAGGIQYEDGRKIIQSENGGIIVTGILAGSSAVFGDTVLSTRGGFDILLVKYDTNGNILWARNEGGINNDRGTLIVESEKYILSGEFNSPTIAFGDTILSSAGGYDAFVAVFDLNWNIINAFTIGGPLDDGGIVDVDPNGMVYTLGGFQSPQLHFGTITLNNLDTLNPQTDLFLAKHSPFTEVKEDGNAQFDFSLKQNYPNPFNPQTAISFSLLAVGNVTLKVYDILGREVATLINNEIMEAGRHEIQFDGSTLTSGVYFYRLNVDGKFSETKKLLLMK
mgnify:CR=1 FL=1